MSLARRRIVVTVALGIAATAFMLQSRVDPRFVGTWVELQGENVIDWYKFDSNGTGCQPRSSSFGELPPTAFRWRVTGDRLVLEYDESKLETAAKYAYYRAARPRLPPSGIWCYEIVSVSPDALQMRMTARIGGPEWIPRSKTVYRDRSGKFVRRYERKWKTKDQ